MLEKLPDSLGHILEDARAGLEKILFNRVDLRAGTGKIEVSSLAFADHAPIPARFTADDEQPSSPSLQWKCVPQGTATLVLIVEDADSPTPAPLVHAIAVDIDPAREGLSEGDLLNSDTAEESDVTLGRNSYLKQAWLPPDPPPGHGPHRYAFQVFALARGKRFSNAPGRDEIAKAIGERALASGCLIGTYARDNTVKTDANALAKVEELPTAAEVAVPA